MSRPLSKRVIGLLALALSPALGACGHGTAVSGTMTLLLTHADDDFTRAVVTIERIELVGDGQPHVLRDVPFTTDLLTLSNHAEALVEEDTIPAGTYTALRFTIPGACIAVEQEDAGEFIYASNGFDAQQFCGGEADGSLELPGSAEAGVEVTLPSGSIRVDGDSSTLMVDFMVSQSFRQMPGGSGSWVMNPVITVDDTTLAGSIVVALTAGADLPDGYSLAHFQARLDTEAMPQAFTDENGDGIYTATFLHLPPDPEGPASYSVSVELEDGAPPLAFTLNPPSPQDSVRFESGRQTPVVFEVTPASAP